MTSTEFMTELHDLLSIGDRQVRMDNRGYSHHATSVFVHYTNLPGGANEHLGRRGRATGGWVVDQNTMRTVAEWKAPMFSTDESDFDVLYRERD